MTSPIRFRTSNRHHPQIDRQLQTLRGVAIVTRGPAEGHNLWCDTTFLEQVRTAINKARPGGIATRDGHLGAELARVQNARIVGDSLRGDLNLPDDLAGDLAGYVMGLAADDPAAFGLSIDFCRDLKAEKDFASAHTDAEGNFVSPDPLNRRHLPHVRLGQLNSIDLVDEPAANPCGLFSLPRETDLDPLLRFAVGLTDTPPISSPLDVEPNRLREYLQRFLSIRGLKISPRRTGPHAPADAAPRKSITPADTSEQSSAPRSLRNITAGARPQLEPGRSQPKPPRNPIRLRT